MSNNSDPVPFDPMRDITLGPHGVVYDQFVPDDFDEFFRKEDFDPRPYGPAFPGGYMNKEDYEAHLAREAFEQKRLEFRKKLEAIGREHATLFAAGKENELGDLERAVEEVFESYVLKD